MLRVMKPVLFAALIYPSIVYGQEVGNAAKGKIVFKTRCAVCHVKTSEQLTIGSELRGVIERLAGAPRLPAAFSPAFKKLREENFIWSETDLRAFLANPKLFIPDNRMNTVGVRDPEALNNLIAFLRVYR